MVQLTLHMLTRGIRSRHCHPLLVICVEKAVTVSLPLPFIFSPTIPIFFSQLLFPKIACRSAMLAALPQSIMGSRARRCHPATHLQKATAVSFPSLYFFPHHSNYFSWLLFANILLVSWLCWLPSLSQLRDQGPIAVN